ncbi:HalOD1 output domain-containing protein [Halorubrum salinum]|uniref:HalOD1 output domain-containing protein n=1 Tax=Halorubrum salinum TaxID=767517 RepID=UPI002112ECD6|nr:HalOD1 output domain-containing protein [Halorubrum salinum]
MDHSSSGNSGASSDLLVELVETLEANGLGRDSYQLYDSIDVEALDQLVESSASAIDVRVTVEGIHLSITQDGVEVIDKPANIPPQ